jgi:hypothetical protein
LDEDGTYYLLVDGKKCQLEVADTFFVITRVEKDNENVILTLSDGATQKLDPTSLYIGRDDVLYCQVREGSFPARFQRAAYYQIAKWVEKTDNGFALNVGGRLYNLAEKA